MENINVESGDKVLLIFTAKKGYYGVYYPDVIRRVCLEIDIKNGSRAECLAMLSTLANYRGYKIPRNMKQKAIADIRRIEEC